MKTSSSTLSPQPPNSNPNPIFNPKSHPALPQANIARIASSRPEHRSPTASPALSDASTADGEASPELPPLPVPRLSDRVLGLLRTPPDSPAAPQSGAAAPQQQASEATDQQDQQDQQSDPPGSCIWGSPYPPHLRSESSPSSHSLDSEGSDDEPIHRLELETPFLRPAPPPVQQQESQPELRLQGISAAAAVLANRARRIAHGITEGWIRQHTLGATDHDKERRHWFSDGSGETDTSSLSDSFSGEEAAWLGSDDDDDDNAHTPRNSRKKKNKTRRRRQPSTTGLWRQSSSETLTQERVAPKKTKGEAATPNMAASDSTPAGDRSDGSTSVVGQTGKFLEPPFVAQRPRTPSVDPTAKPANGTGDATNGVLNGSANGDAAAPTTPARASAKKSLAAAAAAAAVTTATVAPPSSPRVKKRVPWRGKSVMVLLPRDEDRGKPGKPPIPLSEEEVAALLHRWESLGYNIRGFDLYGPPDEFGASAEAQSKRFWPDPAEMRQEHQDRNFRIVLPDLDGRSICCATQRHCQIASS